MRNSRTHRVTPKITVKRKGIEYFVEADCTAHEGEDAVMYYPDGDGYPGSPPEIEVDGCTVLELEFKVRDQPDCPFGWEYRERTDFAAWADDIDRLVLAELRGGAYDDELFQNIEGDDYGI